MLGFRAETFQRVAVIGVFGTQQLDRDFPVKQQVRRTPYLTDATRGDRFSQLVTVIEYEASSRHNQQRLPIRNLVKR
jgi:hypothetical protein